MRKESSPVIDLPEDIVTDWQIVDPVNGKRPERIIHLSPKQPSGNKEPGKRKTAPEVWRHLAS